MAPPAAMNVLARTRDAARGRIGAAGVQADAGERGDAVSLLFEGPCARARQQRRTTIQRRRNRRHQHRLLGVGRTAHAAVADVPAAFYVAPDRAGREAQRLGAAAQGIVVFVGFDRPRGDVEPRFHALEPRCEIGRSKAGDAEFTRPVVECCGRRAEARRPVHGRAAADAASLQDVDRLVASLAAGGFLVQLRIGLGFAHAKVRRGHQRPFLDQHHPQSGVAQDLRGGAAAGAGADDRDVGLEGQIRAERRRRR